MSRPADGTISTWRVVAAFVLDALLAFLLFGYLVAALTGNLEGGNFDLQGAPALVVFALMIAYFVVGNRVLGGTVFRRVLGVPARVSRPPT